MEENQTITNSESETQEIIKDEVPEVFRRKPEKQSKLPLINTVISCITLFVAIVILIVVIMSSLRGPTMLGGGNRLEGFPQGGPTQIGGEQRDAGSNGGNSDAGSGN